MLKNTRVRWTISPEQTGVGETIQDEVGGYILVAVDAPVDTPRIVIYCAVAGLTLE